MAKKKLSPRAQFANSMTCLPSATGSLVKLAKLSWDAMLLASSHDPDHAKELKALDKLGGRLFDWNMELQSRVDVLERQMARIDIKIWNIEH